MEDFSNQNPNLNPEDTNAETLVEKQYDKEKLQRLGGLGNTMMIDSEIESKSPEEREVEDIEVLFSFCDRKNILEILKSDSYGVLLDNEVSLLDLFNADVLFNEQYYSDGYTQEFDLRNYGDKLENFTDRREYNIESKWRLVDYYEQFEHKDLDYAERVRNDETGYLAGDKIRAREAKRAINDIANIYFGEHSDKEKTAQFLEAVKTRADGESLSDGQKEFLREEHNEVADRLLYGGKVVDEKRADLILSTLDSCEEEYEERKAKHKEEKAEYPNIRDTSGTVLVERFIYAEAAINDYIEAGKPELVSESIAKLRELVDKHFEKVVGDHYGITDDHDFRFPELILNYSNPFKLIDRAQQYSLTKFVGHDGNYHPGIIHPDAIVETVADAVRGYKSDATLYISEQAKALKELGASDEAILKNCQNLSPVDFISAESYYDGAGARLVEAGIDKSKIIKDVYSSSGPAWQNEPFKANSYPFEDENYVDVLERNGFDITDIAKTFSPDVIASNLSEFINNGADVKELMKYMMSYREEFEENIVHGDESGSGIFNRMWFDGIRKVMIWDEAHPDGRMVEKEGMRGRGVDYIAARLDIFADNGVTEEDIINNKFTNASPTGNLIPRMIECGRFDTQKVLQLGFEKHKKDWEEIAEADPTFKKFAELQADSARYYSDVIEQLSGVYKKQRDDYLDSLLRKEQQ